MAGARQASDVRGAAWGFLADFVVSDPDDDPCEIVGSQLSSSGRELVRVTLRHVESTTGESLFLVAATELVTATGSTA